MTETFFKVVDGQPREYRIIETNGIPVVVGYEAQLQGVALDGADLSGLDLTKADFTDASLICANLDNCNLSSARLQGCNLLGATLQGSNLSKVITDETTVWTGAILTGAEFDSRLQLGYAITDEYVRLANTVSSSSDASGVSSQLLSQPKNTVDLTGAEVEESADSPTASQPPNSHAETLSALAEGIRKLETTEDWQKYLAAQARFYKYSAGNVMLILEQNPYATQVASYTKWHELNRQVRKGESSLKILAPLTRKNDQDPTKKEIYGFRLASVFDIAQTDGDPIPEPVKLLQGEAPANSLEFLAQVANANGFSVEFNALLAPGVNGQCEYKSNKISIAANDPAQQLKTLAHEIGHALLHGPDNTDASSLNLGHRELEAESVAFIVCERLGVSTGDYSFGYITGWLGGGADALQALELSTTRIANVARKIIDSYDEITASQVAETIPQKSQFVDDLRLEAAGSSTQQIRQFEQQLQEIGR